MPHGRGELEKMSPKLSRSRRRTTRHVDRRGPRDAMRRQMAPRAAPHRRQTLQLPQVQHRAQQVQQNAARKGSRWRGSRVRSSPWLRASGHGETVTDVVKRKGGRGTWAVVAGCAGTKAAARALCGPCERPSAGESKSSVVS